MFVAAVAAAAVAAAVVVAGATTAVRAALCDQLVVIGAGGVGYPSELRVDATNDDGSPRGDCTITIRNDDTTGHSLSPVANSVSVSHWGGLVAYPISQSPSLGNSIVHLVVKADWPENTYPYRCIFKDSEQSPMRGVLVVGSGVCTRNCLPTDVPTPAPPLPCAERCDLAVPPAPACGANNEVLHASMRTARCDMQQVPSRCVWTYDTESCTLNGRTCVDGQCIVAGTAPSPTPPFINECFEHCVNPPQPSCVDATTAVRYDTVGECKLVVGFECVYRATFTDCTDGLGDVCANARCAGVPASAPTTTVSAPTPSSSSSSGGGGGGGGGSSGSSPPASASSPSSATALVSPSAAAAAAGTPSSSATTCFTVPQCLDACAEQQGLASCTCALVTCNSGVTRSPRQQQEVIRVSRAATSAIAVGAPLLIAALIASQFA